MKKNLLFIGMLLAMFGVISAQNTSGDLFAKKFSSNVTLFSDIVLNAPEGINFRAINQGAGIYGTYTFPIEKSNFAFALGAGFTMHNLFSNGMLMDSSTASYFVPYPDSVLDGRTLKYKNNKISLTYLDFPFELRYKHPDGFRFAIGGRLGVKMDAHTKFKGDNPETGDQEKVKYSDLPNFESWRFGPTLQIGYKWVDVTFFYSVTKVFQSNAGPQISPMSLGISLRPF